MRHPSRRARRGLPSGAPNGADWPRASRPHRQPPLRHGPRAGRPRGAACAPDGAQVTSVSIEEIADEEDGDLQRRERWSALTAAGSTRPHRGGGRRRRVARPRWRPRRRVPLAVMPPARPTTSPAPRSCPRPRPRRAAARDPGGTAAHADLGLAGERPFVNVAAAGLAVPRRSGPHKSASGRSPRLGALHAGVTAPSPAVESAPRRRAPLHGPRLAGGRRGLGRVRRGQPDRRHADADGLLDVAAVPAGPAAGSRAAPTACAPASSPTARTTSTTRPRGPRSTSTPTRS